MANLHYLHGDATEPEGDGKKIIAHVCNNIGAWGAGFVLAASRKFPEAEKFYRGLDNRRLGMVQYIHIAGEDIILVIDCVKEYNVDCFVYEFGA